MAYIEISHLCPLWPVDKNRELPVNYHFKHFDAWKSYEQFMEMETGPFKPQKWQNSDIIFLQVMSDISPIQVKVRNIFTKQVVVTHQMTQVAFLNNVGYFQDQIALDNTGIFPDALYRVEFYGGDPIQIKLECEEMYVKECHPNTMLVKYSNSFNDLAFLWETMAYVLFRFDGVIPTEETKSARTGYIDQVYAGKTVKGRAYREAILSIGTQGGSPKWQVDKMSDILNCTSTVFDGKPFSVLPGADFEMKKIKDYPYWQGNMRMLEFLNRRAKRFEGSGIVEEAWATDYSIEGSLFGPIAGSANDNSYLIDKVKSE